MSKVAVVTDTTHYAPRALLQAHDIREVSLYVNLGGRDERESDMADFTAFYNQLRQLDQLPTTSQPSIGDFLEVYEPLRPPRAATSSRTTSPEGLPAPWRARVRPRPRSPPSTRPGRVEVIDSAPPAAASASAHLAGAARREHGRRRRRRRRRGSTTRLTPMKICSRSTRSSSSSAAVASAPAQAWLGGALKIKPILTINREIDARRARPHLRPRLRAHGRLPQGSLRGRRRRLGRPAPIKLHEQAAKLVERGHEIYGTGLPSSRDRPRHRGTHVGPGLLGAGGLPRALLAELGV